MSQIHNVNTPQVNLPQEQPGTAQVESSRSSRLSEVAQTVDAGAAPAPRVRRSFAGIFGRVALGIVTLGISEAVRAFVNKKRGNATNAPAAPAANYQALEPNKYPDISQARFDTPKGVENDGVNNYPDADKMLHDKPVGTPEGETPSLATVREENLSVTPRQTETSKGVEQKVFAHEEATVEERAEIRKDVADTAAAKQESLAKFAEQNGVTVDNLIRFIPGFRANFEAATSLKQLETLLENISGADLEKCQDVRASLTNGLEAMQDELLEELGNLGGKHGLDISSQLAKPEAWKGIQEQIINLCKVTKDSTPEEISAALGKAVKNFESSMDSVFERIGTAHANDGPDAQLTLVFNSLTSAEARIEVMAG